MKKTIIAGIVLLLISSWLVIRILQPNPEFFELPAFTKERDQVLLRIYCFKESPDFDRHFENDAKVQASLLASNDKRGRESTDERFKDLSKELREAMLEHRSLYRDTINNWPLVIATSGEISENPRLRRIVYCRASGYPADLAVLVLADTNVKVRPDPESLAVLLQQVRSWLDQHYDSKMLEDGSLFDDDQASARRERLRRDIKWKGGFLEQH